MIDQILTEDGDAVLAEDGGLLLAESSGTAFAWTPVARGVMVWAPVERAGE